MSGTAAAAAVSVTDARSIVDEPIDATTFVALDIYALRHRGR